MSTVPYESTWLRTREEESAVLWNGARLTLRQLSQEMGVGVGSWYPNSAIWRFCVFHNPLTQSPSLSLFPSLTQTTAVPPCLPVFCPPEVRVWYQPICFSRPCNPGSRSHAAPNLPVPAQYATATPEPTAGLPEAPGREGVKWAEKERSNRKRVLYDPRPCLNISLKWVIWYRQSRVDLDTKKIGENFHQKDLEILRLPEML